MTVMRAKRIPSYFVLIPVEVARDWLSDEDWDRYVLLVYDGHELRIKPLKFVETKPREVE